MLITDLYIFSQDDSLLRPDGTSVSLLLVENGIPVFLVVSS